MAPLEPIEANRIKPNPASEQETRSTEPKSFLQKYQAADICESSPQPPTLLPKKRTLSEVIPNGKEPPADFVLPSDHGINYFVPVLADVSTSSILSRRARFDAWKGRNRLCQSGSVHSL